MGLFKKKDNLSNWIKSATDEELEDAYEIRRKKWEETGFGGDGEKTPEMKILNEAIGRRYDEKWENDPRRNTDPNFHWTDANRWDND